MDVEALVVAAEVATMEELQKQLQKLETNNLHHQQEQMKQDIAAMVMLE